MSYRVELVKSAERALRRLPVEDAARVGRAIDALADEPRPRASKKLSGLAMWRLRVGEYRVLYTLSDRMKCITVHQIERRTTTTYD